MSGENKKRIPLFDLVLEQAAKEEVHACLDSGWLTSGPRVEMLEKRVAEFLGMEHAAAVSSCTTGLQIVLSILGAGRGKEVITSPYTFAGTIEAIMHAGARPVLADINPSTLNVDPDDIERKITDKTAAVVPVDIAGYPCDYGRIGALCETAGIPLISDSAHAIAATYQSQSVPHHTDTSIYSFYSTKNLTCGEGGMVVSKHKELIETIKLLRRHALSVSTKERSDSGRAGYDIHHLGFKANLSDLHAAVGLGQLTVLEKNQCERSRLADRYREILSDLDQFCELPGQRGEYGHGWHLFIIKLHLPRLRIDRDQLLKEMLDYGIECGVHFQPLYEFSFFRDTLALTEEQFPQTSAVSKRVLSLPFYPGLSDSDLEYVCDTLRNVLTKNSN
ncbi:MAG: DegT/DnrJ/EryC1/StrS family aminotransferase [bacterium]|nr:DegT/DnrJ/EryC1/StrS family aminotransferase [bacterium]